MLQDLKLENFLFESRGTDSQLKLIDFGLSKRFMVGSAGGPVDDEMDEKHCKILRMASQIGTPYYTGELRSAA